MKSWKIRESEPDWSPCTWLHSDFAIEAKDAEKLTRVLIQKEVLPRGRNDFLSCAVFQNRCTLLSKLRCHIFSHNSVKLSYILLYFRSNLLYFSYISGLNLLYSPIFQVKISYIFAHLLYFLLHQSLDTLILSLFSLYLLFVT